MKIQFDLTDPVDVQGTLALVATQCRIDMVLSNAPEGHAGVVKHAEVSADGGHPDVNPQTEAAAPVEKPAPAETEQPAIDSVAGVELDSNGTPWLQEVHAGTKTKNQNGTWKKKRGVDDDLLETSEAAARAKLAGTPEPTLPTAEETAEVEAAPTPETVAPTTMEDLASAYQDGLDAEAVTPEDVSAMYAKHGCANLTEVQTNETARAGIVADIRAAIEAKQAAPAGAVLPGM